MSGAPDPKPRKRFVASSQAYLRLVRILLRRYPRCELCGTAYSESMHHVVPRGNGGDDVEENLVALCGSGTTGCHGSVESSAQARHLLRLKLRPEVVTYAVGRKGLNWLDRRYPQEAP